MLTAYRDIGGVWTIGDGITSYPDGSSVQPGDVITDAQADHLLTWRMTASVAAVQRVTPPSSADFQIGAMADLAYNIGTGNFLRSTLIRLFLAGDINGAAEQFLVWDKAHVDGQLVTVHGLLNRREAERAMFLGQTVVSTM